MKKPSSCKYCTHRKECNTYYLKSLKDGSMHLCMYDNQKDEIKEGGEA